MQVAHLLLIHRPQPRLFHPNPPAWFRQRLPPHLLLANGLLGLQQNLQSLDSLFTHPRNTLLPKV